MSILADWCCSRLHHSDVMVFGEVFVFRFVTVKVTFIVEEIKSLSNCFGGNWQSNCNSKLLHTIRKWSPVLFFFFLFFFLGDICTFDMILMVKYTYKKSACYLLKPDFGPTLTKGCEKWQPEFLLRRFKFVMWLVVLIGSGEKVHFLYELLQFIVRKF